MEEFSLYVLDITMNSVRAGADKIDISLAEKEGVLTFTVTDNGCGMTAEQVEKLTDPFFTTRKTRAVGLGIPFLRMLSMMTEGDVKITSKDKENHPLDHGTTVTATFGCEHIDFIPMGDLTGTLVTLIQGSPDVDFTYSHTRGDGEVRFSCREIREVLGGEISLSEPEILNWIRSNLDEQYENLK